MSYNTQEALLNGAFMCSDRLGMGGMKEWECSTTVIDSTTQLIDPWKTARACVAHKCFVGTEIAQEKNQLNCEG